MLRDSNKIVGDAHLSVPENHSVIVLLNFVDAKISGFRNYYFSIPLPPEGENAITYHLANYFNALLIDENDGFLPYKFNFVKNPTQSESRRETDLGVVILSKSMPSYPIIEFEAKRLSGSSNNTEYVYGERGGIERFKKNHHGTQLKICGMLGYVQKDTANDWFNKINGWITEQSNNTTTALDWKNQSELLVHIWSHEKVNKYSSMNVRLSQSSLTIYHYLIDLVN
jgi:hypothetical protein